MRSIAYLLLTLLFIGCKASEEIQPAVFDRELLTVKTELVEKSESGVQGLEFSGKVRAAKSLKASFLRGGRIISLSKDDGDRVQKGELLGQLDTRSIEARQAELRAQLVEAQASSSEIEAPPRRFEREAALQQVREIEANLELVETKLTRRQALFASGAIPKENLDELVSQKNTLESQKLAALNRVKDLDAGARPQTKQVGRARIGQVRASLDGLQVDIADSELRAPFSATVVKRLVDEGTIVAAGQTVYELITEGELEVEIFLPPSKAEKLVPGELLELEIEGATHTGRVKDLLPVVDDGRGTRPVLLTLPRTGAVQAGQLARLKLESQGEGQGYWLPSTALLPGERGLFTCYTITPTDDDPTVFEVERQSVELLETTGEKAFVRGTLTGTASVITEGIQRVVPGQKVRRK